MEEFLRDLWDYWKQEIAFLLETKEQATKRRQRQAVLTVFGQMGAKEQQAFRQRGGVLPEESGWLDPGSPEWHASFESGGYPGKAAPETNADVE